MPRRGGRADTSWRCRTSSARRCFSPHTRYPLRVPLPLTVGAYAPPLSSYSYLLCAQFLREHVRRRAGQDHRTTWHSTAGMPPCTLPSHLPLTRARPASWPPLPCRRRASARARASSWRCCCRRRGCTRPPTCAPSSSPRRRASRPTPSSRSVAPSNPHVRPSPIIPMDRVRTSIRSGARPKSACGLASRDESQPRHPGPLLAPDAIARSPSPSSRSRRASSSSTPSSSSTARPPRRWFAPSSPGGLPAPVGDIPSATQTHVHPRPSAHRPSPSVSLARRRR